MVENNTVYRVNGYIGKWGVADRYRGYVLMEHITLGDETCYLVVSARLKPRMATYITKNGLRDYPTLYPKRIFETFDDIKTTLKTEGVI